MTSVTRRHRAVRLDPRQSLIPCAASGQPADGYVPLNLPAENPYLLRARPRPRVLPMIPTSTGLRTVPLTEPVDRFRELPVDPAVVALAEYIAGLTPYIGGALLLDPHNQEARDWHAIFVGLLPVVQEWALPIRIEASR